MYRIIFMFNFQTIRIIMQIIIRIYWYIYMGFIFIIISCFLYFFIFVIISSCFFFFFFRFVIQLFP